MGFQCWETTLALLLMTKEGQEIPWWWRRRLAHPMLPACLDLQPQSQSLGAPQDDEDDEEEPEWDASAIADENAWKASEQLVRSASPSTAKKGADARWRASHVSTSCTP